MTTDIAQQIRDGQIVVSQELMHAEQLRVQGDLDEAMRVCSRYMNDHFSDVPAIVLFAHIMLDAEKFGVAQALLLLASKLMPNEALIWNDLGICYQEGSDLKEGEIAFMKALHREPNNALALNNLAQLYNNMGQPLKAINCADKVIRLDPSMTEAQYNRGIAMLQLGDWKEGWRGYEYGIGIHMGRKERIYGHIPRWTGVNDCTVIAYGEQGLGDEISFASCIPDLMQENRVIIECDKRLENLFRRSFGCPVYGTRYSKGVEWPHNHEIDAAVALGSLPGFYRNSAESFPGTPYLTPDPQRRIQWRALLDSLGQKPKVGIAWTGGIKRTGAARRSMELAEMLPILRQDATFISLQYKDAPEITAMRLDHGIEIHHWPHAVQTGDYDDTAALVSELDLVITVQQTAVHIAGALGIPCWVMVPKTPLWRYGLSGDKFPWANSVKLYRQKEEWVHVVSEVAVDLRKFANEGLRNAPK